MAFHDVSSSYGRKGQPRIKAVCDSCPRDEVIGCPKGAEGHAVKKIQEMGWSWIKKVLRCPKCEAKRKAENMSQKAKADTPMRQPTREQRRAIMDMLRDVYDVDAECYKNGDTDDAVADVLQVMPGWVAAIRCEFYGENAGNQDMSELSGQLETFLKDARALVAKRDSDTDAIAAAIKQVEKFSQKINAIKKAVGPRVMAKVK